MSVDGVGMSDGSRANDGEKESVNEGGRDGDGKGCDAETRPEEGGEEEEAAGIGKNLDQMERDTEEQSRENVRKNVERQTSCYVEKRASEINHNHQEVKDHDVEKQAGMSEEKQPVEGKGGGDADMFGFRRLSDPTKSSSASDTQRVIVKDDSSDSVVSDGRGVQGRGEPQSLRERLHDIMTTQAFHIAILVLVILDCVLVVTELVLDFQLLESESNCEVNGTAKPPEDEVSAVHILHYFSLTILSIFMLELIVKILVFQMEFFRSKLEVFDGLVIIVSFVLDILSLIYEEEFAAAQLIVLLRLWRIVRVVNGVILSVETQAEKKIEQQKHLCEEIEHELEKFRQYCTAQEKEIEILRNTLNQHGIKIEDDYVAEKPKISLNQVNVVVEVNASEKLQLGVEADEDKPPEERDGLGERKGEADQGKPPREGVQLEPAPRESVTLGDETTRGGTVQAEFHSNASSVA